MLLGGSCMLDLLEIRQEAQARSSSRMESTTKVQQESQKATSVKFQAQKQAGRRRRNHPDIVPTFLAKSLPCGDLECQTGNGATGRMSRTGKCCPFGLLFQFLCDILRPQTPHPVQFGRAFETIWNYWWSRWGRRSRRWGTRARRSRSSLPARSGSAELGRYIAQILFKDIYNYHRTI